MSNPLLFLLLKGRARLGEFLELTEEIGLFYFAACLPLEVIKFVFCKVIYCDPYLGLTECIVESLKLLFC